jgi:hypothetical protein
MSKFWRGHPATTHQQQLLFGAARKHRKPTQTDVLIGLLRDSRSKRPPLELPAIMRAGIAQHGARFKEIREQGFHVENEMERTSEGAVISRYWLRFDPESDGGNNDRAAATHRTQPSLPLPRSGRIRRAMHRGGFRLSAPVEEMDLPAGASTA